MIQAFGSWTIESGKANYIIPEQKRAQVKVGYVVSLSGALVTVPEQYLYDGGGSFE